MFPLASCSMLGALLLLPFRFMSIIPGECESADALNVRCSHSAVDMFNFSFSAFFFRLNCSHKNVKYIFKWRARADHVRLLLFIMHAFHIQH